MTAAWWEGPLVGFDLETTGPDPETARIVTACVVLDVPGRDPEVRTWLADPGVDIPDAAAAVHGITTEHARAHGQDPADVVAKIMGALAVTMDDHRAPVVAFNASFDFTVLDREARRHGFDPLHPDPVIDPFVLDKQLDRYRRGKRKLVAVAAHYGVTLDDAHTADADALAAVHVVRAMGRIAPFPPPDQLHRAQVAWRAEQCASLEDYFRRTKDPDTVIAREWPVLPLPVGATA